MCRSPSSAFSVFFFFNDTATTEIYTLSLHDALPICRTLARQVREQRPERRPGELALQLPQRRNLPASFDQAAGQRSEEHTSELQSLAYLVCRLLLEKKKKHVPRHTADTHDADQAMRF